MKYEKDDPQTAPLLQAFAKVVMKEPAARPAGHPEHLAYYKGNMNPIVGDGEVVPWPLYTSRLDIEPELAVVYGTDRQPVAGVCSFNDVSARDIQALEVTVTVNGAPRFQGLTSEIDHKAEDVSGFLETMALSRLAR